MKVSGAWKDSCRELLATAVGSFAEAWDNLEVWVFDEGTGRAGTTNLFVPFFTTKPNGSGIGLSRQIAEAHGGMLTLENRSDRTGCKAVVVLPV